MAGYPDPETLDRDELLAAFDELLHETCNTGIRWHTRFGYGAAALEGEHEIDVWTPPDVLLRIQRSIGCRTGHEFDVPKFANKHFTMQLVAVLNALDADVERVLEGGIPRRSEGCISVSGEWREI